MDVVAELPREKFLCEVKYRNHPHVPNSDAIVELCREKKNGVTGAFLLTKQLNDIGVTAHGTEVPIMRIPSLLFLYLLGKAEADGMSGKL